MYIQTCILYSFKYDVLHETFSLKVILGPKKKKQHEFEKFQILFISDYSIPSLSQLLFYVFDFSFLKIILRCLFMSFYMERYNCYFS